MLNNIENVLVLAPHTDDGELGVGATIAKLIELGKKVTYVAFSDSRESLSSNHKPETLINECKRATSVLGIRPENLIFLDFKVREFACERQRLLDELIRIKRSNNYDLVFTPMIGDVHQDHQVVTQESCRAFKHVSLIGYELPWNLFEEKNVIFSEVDERAKNAKIRSLKCYESQMHRSYMQERFVSSQLIFRAGQAGMHYAEMFSPIRIIWRD
jgi:N-acetylglucosamine malate deacetylase 1